MPKFKLNPDHPAVDLFAPEYRGGDSFTVEPGKTVDVAGKIVTEGAPEDAYLVDNNGTVAAWPKALWELVEPPKQPAPKSATAKEN